MAFTNFIRGIVKNNPEIKTKLRQAGSKQTPFQYVYQSFMMTVMSTIGIFIIMFLVFKSHPLYLLIGTFCILILSFPLFKFWFSYVDVQIRKYARSLEGDLLFVSEYFLVSLESGLPLGNAIQGISKLNRPGGKFFKKVFTEFKTGKDLEAAIGEAAAYAPSDMVKNLLKRLKDSLSIGVDLKSVLENFIKEASEKKIIEIRGYSKKLNPIIMMYLLVGIVLPSLGLTFFILGATLMNVTPQLLKYMLMIVFLIMFAFQYMSYSSFKFSKSTI